MSAGKSSETGARPDDRFFAKFGPLMKNIVDRMDAVDKQNGRGGQEAGAGVLLIL
jgi:hypothetical protein